MKKNAVLRNLISLNSFVFILVVNYEILPVYAEKTRIGQREKTTNPKHIVIV